MAKRNGKTCVLFEEVPEGTQYRKGNYSWVQHSTAEKYIKKGYGVEYDPYKKEVVELEDAEELPTLPDDLPGRNHFIDAGIEDLEEVQALSDSGDLQTVDGIGSSTEHKIEVYLEDN